MRRRWPRPTPGCCRRSATPSNSGARALVYVDDLSAPGLGPDDRYHLSRVLRLRSGEAVTASDGLGGWRPCEFAAPDRLTVVGEISYQPRVRPAITVAFALTKGERPEWTVQKLVEAGVDRVVAMSTSRTIVRWEGEKASRHVDRLRAVARAAAMQSRQVWLPVVSDVASFAEVVAGAGRSVEGAACLAHPGGGPPDLRWPAVLTGPEGGWDDDELNCGLPTIGLGPTVLRAETAAMMAGMVLCALRAGIVRPG